VNVTRAALIVVIAALACTFAACGGGDEGGGAGAGGATVQAPPAATSATEPPAATTRPADRPPSATPAKAASFAVGIGEQGAAMFADRRFRSLGVDKARLVVPYDAVGRRTERELADAWIGAAQAAGIEPFITFGHSRANPEKLPSVGEFRSAFRAFRQRYPAVRVYAPWNEINHVSQPTSRSPRRAAEYFNVMRADCSDCTVVAGDVLDQAGMTRYVREYRRHLAAQPAIWGLHNYGDTNRFRTRGLRDLLRTVRGDVWLTETGGIVKLGRSLPRDERRAARAVSYALKLARDHERVKRVYFYNWTAARPADRFDSGLMGTDGRPRPGYDALRAGLRR
jgi:hypothetical protein